ncbi:MAG: isochorismatase family protein [Burkholderiaceae bacterium]
MGKRPAMLVIDMQYRSLGHEPRPIEQAVLEYKTSCGDRAWRAVPGVSKLIAHFRSLGLPVIFPHVAPKGPNDGGRLADKLPGVLSVPPAGYEFVREVAPAPGEITIAKYHASAFFGTALISHLVDHRIDTLFVTGGTTSGCVRATAVDASSLGFKVVVPFDCVYDRSQTCHAVNLFDLASKYADVVDVDRAIELASTANAS